MAMTSIERITNTLNLQPVDKIAIDITPWPETIKLWAEQGHIKEGDGIPEIRELFEGDLQTNGWLNIIADIDFEPVILEETEDTVLTLDGNGATLRTHKHKSGTPEHVDYKVKDRSGWEEYIKPHITKTDRRRFNSEGYRQTKQYAAENQRFYCWEGAGPFEMMQIALGHESLLMGMALDPEWVKEMVMTYSDFVIRHLEILFAEEGKPDGIFFYEDMGFKFKPFMSPQMYKEIMQPGHKRLFDYFHSIGCKIIVHSCGFVEPLLPGMIEAGMDCLQAMEVKAGMHMPKLFEMYGDKIAFFGGIDTRALISNDKAEIDSELKGKMLPVIKGGGSYILHSDHSEPPEVNFETMHYFFEKGREITQKYLTA